MGDENFPRDTSDDFDLVRILPSSLGMLMSVAILGILDASLEMYFVVYE